MEGGRGVQELVSIYKISNILDLKDKRKLSCMQINKELQIVR